MTTLQKRLLTGTACGIGLIAVCAMAMRSGPAPVHEEEAAAPEAETAVAIQAAKVELQTLRPALDLVGTVVAIPERIAVISAQQGGWVERLAVVEGQSVKAGDLLIQLDPRTDKTHVDRAKALVAEKEAALARLKSGYLPQELEAARQDRDKAQAAVDGLSGELAALQELLARHEISNVHYDMKDKTLKAAQAALASAEAHVKLLEEGTRSEMIDEAVALLDVAKADLEHAELALDWCQIRSPIDGVVVQLLARQGQFFDRAVSLGTVIDLSELFVQVRIPSAEFANVRVGNEVDVTATSAPKEVFRGTVARIGGEADPLTGNIMVYVAIKNREQHVRPGFGCQARVFLPEIKDVVAVPMSAVADRSGTPVVTVVRDGKAYEVEVRLGTETHEFVQIVEGLEPGDVVATAGGYGLPEGCPVRILPDIASAAAVKP
jgi:multidrug efflux pump subunit AcrA (membrane-fusion protein)